MARRSPKEPLFVVLGATGTGKSQLAVDLATRFNGEIINGDAMQMYDGLPIITNKITTDEQQGITHHLLGNVALDQEPWTVGMFKKKASNIIREIRGRGRLPILVGGTHYYTQSLLFQDSLVGEDFEEDGSIKAHLSADEISQRYPILDGPPEAILERLKEVDPVMANHWHPNEHRKIRRSLAIFLTTGRQASSIYQEQKLRKGTRKDENLSSDEAHSNNVPYDSPLLFWVHSDSEVLKRRLDGRIKKMIDVGLLDEVKSMDSFLDTQKASRSDVDLGRGIWISIGWKEFRPYLKALKAGSSSPDVLTRLYDSSIERTQIATRQYAKRQVRWIRLKLRNALAEAGLVDKLYLLDSSNVDEWEAKVSLPAIDVAAKFLNGDMLPSPQRMSVPAQEILAPIEVSDEATDPNFRQECHICHVISVTEHQWNIHLKGRRHRALLKKHGENANTRSLVNNNSTTEAT
ncbi:mitochondrial putative tRNA dimethylallyltransferase [Amylocarpus encephaloides]|uniref:tRNA dimethylallyltransferase n=1 Tax=Amylocarpus encephaloides TaxID=45428 RepID=A0A9P8C8Z8_9HELO|nr:mitochondrial putative tRNA dimethylallyltransferase [Amylocarpus encephaloides]